MLKNKEESKPTQSLTTKADKVYTNYNIYNNESCILINKATEETYIELQAPLSVWLYKTLLNEQCTCVATSNLKPNLSTT